MRNFNPGSEEDLQEAITSCVELELFYHGVEHELITILWRLGVIKKELSAKRGDSDLVFRNLENIEHNLKIVKKLIDENQEVLQKSWSYNELHSINQKN